MISQLAPSPAFGSVYRIPHAESGLNPIWRQASARQGGIIDIHANLQAVLLETLAERLPGVNASVGMPPGRFPVERPENDDDIFIYLDDDATRHQAALTEAAIAARLLQVKPYGVPVQEKIDATRWVEGDYRQQLADAKTPITTVSTIDALVEAYRQHNGLPAINEQV